MQVLFSAQAPVSINVYIQIKLIDKKTLFIYHINDAFLRGMIRKCVKNGQNGNLHGTYVDKCIKCSNCTELNQYVLKSCKASIMNNINKIEVNVASSCSSTNQCVEKLTNTQNALYHDGTHFCQAYMIAKKS